MASVLVTGTEAASGGLCGAVGGLKKTVLGKWPQGCSSEESNRKRRIAWQPHEQPKLEYTLVLL